jgi:hypothetical protein
MKDKPPDLEARMMRRLFSAYQHGHKLQLQVEDIEQLMKDDAIRSRISNAAAREAGAPEPGSDCIPQPSSMRWGDFVKFFRSGG